MTRRASAWPSIRARWLTAHRLAQLGICVQFLAIVRTLAEFFRLKSVQGEMLRIEAVTPFIGGALLAAVLTWAGVLCYFANRDRAAVAVAGATIIALVGIKDRGTRAMSGCPKALEYVCLSIALGLVQILACSHAASLQRGYRWTASARDESPRALTGVAGRLERALHNFCETFPLFLAAVLVASLTARCGEATIIGCRMYFWARVAYVPLYVFGVPLVRSLGWNVATIGIIVILVGAWVS